MQIPRHAIYDPDRNTAFAVAAVALSLFVFAYSWRFGQISILAFYACWLPALMLAPRILLDRIVPVLILLVLPTLAALSVVWSEAASTTLRAAVQYGTTILCGLVAARLVSLQNLAYGMTVGGILVLLYSVSVGRYDYDVVDGTYAFVGAFGSKNQLGYFAALTLIFALSCLTLFRMGPGARLASVAALPLALGTLVASDSATAVISTAVAFAAILTMRFLVALGPALRAALVFALVGAVLMTAIVALQVGAFDALLGAFGKDATLTGRTYLWTRGWEIGSEGGWLGLGYYAFWIHGRPEAEEIWRAFYITSRAGFHFHNTFMEAFVGLGVPGLALTIMTGLALIVMPALASLRPLAGPETTLLSGLALLFLIRAFVEVDFLTPYTVGSFLVPFVLLRLGEGERVRQLPAVPVEQFGGGRVASPDLRRGQLDEPV